MAIQVETTDCTALPAADLEAMGELCRSMRIGHSDEALAEHAAEWVLVTIARDGEDMVGFSFFTLERVGGTPCILVGFAALGRIDGRDGMLETMMADQFRRAVLAFPDEDVLVGSRLISPAGFDIYATLTDIVPRPDHKASGEERAWGRRIAKRFGVGNSKYEDRAFIARGNGSLSLVFDHLAADQDSIDPAVVELFADVKVDDGDSLIAFGWALAEDLAELVD